MDFNVLNTMDLICSEIKAEGISIKQQFLATAYYEKKMQKYRENQKLVIFGAGQYGRQLYRMMKREKFADHVVCFCDNSQKNQQRMVEGLDVLSPGQAVKRYSDAMYIITPIGYEDEMLEQLCELGVSGKNISIFIIGLTGLEG